MDRDALRRTIENIRNMDCRDFSEPRVKRNIVEPILRDLNWNVDDQDEVIFEYGTSGRERVDYALCEKGRLLAFIEAKGARENLSQHKEQLLRYAFEKGVYLAALTNGLHWWFYLPMMKERDWDKRRFCMIDLKNENTFIVCNTFTSFLSKEKVISGEAVQNAEETLKSREARERVKKTVPKAWNSLIEKPDSRLVDLIAESAEQLFGSRPSPTDVMEFLEKNKSKLVLPENDGPPQEPRTRGVRLVYVPEINQHTFLHFSWDGIACALRDYSKSATIQPRPDRRYNRSFVEARVEKDDTPTEHPNRKHIDFWHGKTVEANEKYLKK